MKVLSLTQSDLGEACRITQPHLSKVLSGKIKLAKKTEARLRAWLDRTNDNGIVRGTARAFVIRLERLRPDRHGQVIELLRAIERLLQD